jgi:hypothetical protein
VSHPQWQAVTAASVVALAAGGGAILAGIPYFWLRSRRGGGSFRWVARVPLACLALGAVVIAGSAPLLYLGLTHDRRGIERAEARAIAALPDDAHLVARHEGSEPSMYAKYRIERRRSDVERELIRSLERRGLIHASDPGFRPTDQILSLNIGPRYYAEIRFATAMGATPTVIEVSAYIED